MTAGTGVLVRLHCNGCGGVFETDEHFRRFCSNDCARAFWAPLARRLPSRQYAWAQGRLLEELRRVGGDWVTVGTLIRSVWGIDDDSTRRCFRVTLNRLRATWGDRGLVIACSVRRLVPDRVDGTSYRLVSDITDDTMRQIS